MDLHPLRLGPERGVSSLSVSATGEPAAFRPLTAGPPRRVELTIEDCQLGPKLVVARVGDTLAIENTIDYAFLTAISGDPVQQAVPRGHPREITLERPGVRSVTCSFAAECNRSDVVILTHRAATVSDEAGRFELEVPAGTPVTLHAWHPLLGPAEATAEATVGEGETVDVTIELAPPDALSAPPNPTTGDGGPEMY